MYHSEKQSASVKRQVYNALHDIFVTLQFQPTVLRNDGGNLCGFIACNIVKYLLEITDAEELFETDSFSKYHYGPLNNSVNKEKAICLRRDILADYFLWIYNGFKDDDLYSSSKDKSTIV